MGYESKLYIVEKYPRCRREDGKCWGEILVTLNMCKCYPFSYSFKKDTDCYIYGFDKDEEITEDMYGDKLKEMTLTEAIKLLNKIMKDEENEYWRFNVLLATLKEIKKQRKYMENKDYLVVIHFGY